jgi:serine/threonine-protein kinase 24/25/MST4
MEQDEWVFDTVKQATVAPVRNGPKRRKAARIPSDASGITSTMQRMDLNTAPLGTPSNSPERRRPESRQASSATVIRVSSGDTPTARRVSNFSKQPLGVDLSFGNSPSTVRHFKRVSSGERRAALSSNPSPSKESFHPNPNAKTFRPSSPTSGHPRNANDENEPPMPEYPPTPITRDALYGRRAYSKVLDSVFHEALAESGSPHQREAIAKVAQAWAHLDQVDPHGEFMLLKAMVDRLQADSRLAQALGIAVSPASSPLKHNTKTSESSLSGTTVHGTSTTRQRVRSNTAATSIRSIVKSTNDLAASPVTRPSTAIGTSLSTPMGAAPSSPLKGPRLILAQNNPHLKSHRRRQSAVVGGEKGTEQFTDLDEKKLPGHVEKGMEQQGLLADILYGQWIGGLRNRWPLA